MRKVRLRFSHASSICQSDAPSYVIRGPWFSELSPAIHVTPSVLHTPPTPGLHSPQQHPVHLPELCVQSPYPSLPWQSLQPERAGRSKEHPSSYQNVIRGYQCHIPSLLTPPYNFNKQVSYFKSRKIVFRFRCASSLFLSMC